MTDVLTAIDDALDAGVATDADPLTRELQELALAVRADAPEPTDEFSAWLGQRVEEGFPKRKPAGRPLWLKLLHPAPAISPWRMPTGSLSPPLRRAAMPASLPPMPIWC